MVVVNASNNQLYRNEFPSTAKYESYISDTAQVFIYFRCFKALYSLENERSAASHEKVTMRLPLPIFAAAKTAPDH